MIKINQKNINVFKLLLVITIIVLFSNTTEATQPINIYVDSTKLIMSTNPVIVNNRVLVPIRHITEAIGGYAGWDPLNRTVVISTDNNTVQLKIGSRRAVVNGKEVILDVPAQIIDDYTFVPIRFVSENLGTYVEWHKDINSLLIISTCK